jgi:hypothetical protein
MLQAGDLLRRYGHRGEDNVKRRVRNVGWNGIDWVHLAKGRDK